MKSCGTVMLPTGVLRHAAYPACGTATPRSDRPQTVPRAAAGSTHASLAGTARSAAPCGSVDRRSTKRGRSNAAPSASQWRPTYRVPPAASDSAPLQSSFRSPGAGGTKPGGGGGSAGWEMRPLR